MKLSIRKLTLVFAMGLVFTAMPVKALEFPPATGHVNDWADIFSPDFENSLEKDLVTFEKETTAEIAVVTVKDLQETTIEDFAVRLFEDWGIGKADEDNGLLLLIAPNDRELRIEVGYGLEPVVTDGRAGRIIRNEITPEFKQNNYEGGVANGVEAIQKYIRTGSPPADFEAVADQAEENIPVVLIFFFLIVYLAGFWGRSKRVWPGGLIGALLGLVLSLIIGTFAWVILLALFGLFLDWLLSKNYKKLKKAGRSTNWWSSGGGFFSGGSRGGGSFGGFSGGSSGGGGASGSW